MWKYIVQFCNWTWGEKIEWSILYTTVKCRKANTLFQEPLVSQFSTEILYNFTVHVPVLWGCVLSCVQCSCTRRMRLWTLYSFHFSCTCRMCILFSFHVPIWWECLLCTVFMYLYVKYVYCVQCSCKCVMRMCTLFSVHLPVWWCLLCAVYMYLDDEDVYYPLYCVQFVGRVM